MNLKFVKPDLTYFEQYNEMMKEWAESGTRIAPWFLGEPFININDFASFIKMLDNCENGIVDEKFCSTTSFFVLNETNKLIGAASLRHYLTVAGFNSWGVTSAMVLDQANG